MLSFGSSMVYSSGWLVMCVVFVVIIVSVIGYSSVILIVNVVSELVLMCWCSMKYGG